MKPIIPVFVSSLGNDPQAQILMEELLNVGARPYPLELICTLERRVPIIISEDTLVWGECDFCNVRVAHLRFLAPGVPSAPPPRCSEITWLGWCKRFLEQQEQQAAFFSFCEELSTRGTLVVNQPKTYLNHETKPHLYEMLRRGNFPVPVTLTTNDPNEATSFIQDHERVVSKPGSGIGPTCLIDSMAQQRLSLLPCAPAMFQKYLPGNTLRVHVVGRRVVLALRILGQEIDSRSQTGGFDIISLPSSAASMIGAATDFLGLHYAAWDVREVSDGTYVLLDCNPGSYIFWIGTLAARFVLRSLALFLTTYAQTQSVEEAEKALISWPLNEEGFAVRKLTGLSKELFQSLDARRKSHLRLRH